MNDVYACKYDGAFLILEEFMLRSWLEMELDGAWDDGINGLLVGNEAWDGSYIIASWNIGEGEVW